MDDSIEKEVYVVLIKDLSRDPSECLHVIGLWLWLSCPTIIRNILYLPLFIINELVDEAVKCLECLDPQSPEPSSAIEFRPISKPRVRFNLERSEIQLTRDLLNNHISLHYLRRNRHTFFGEVQNFVSNVCIPKLVDLFERARHGEFRDSPASCLAMSAIPPEFLGNRVPGWNVDIDRTLFVTFTRGGKVEELELVGFLEQGFGCVAEMIDLQTVPPGEQPLYARVVVCGPVNMSSIVEGDNRAMCNVNGKDVWIRRYVPRRSASD